MYAYCNSAFQEANKSDEVEFGERDGSTEQKAVRTLTHAEEELCMLHNTIVRCNKSLPSQH